ncbi:hypothetical protein NW249_26180 [Streptomyces sp. OUCMDZ-4982]|nr:hypothetical protein [Streptomyces sp. OUCMDZ-4982]MCR8945599.1 hypothetical protein [Streptomyces sp. OUCMDZ-4982]
MDHRIIAAGIETCGALTRWSDITSITLVREPEVTHEGMAISQGYWRIVIDLTTGDFIEIPQYSPSWNQVLHGLPKHRTLRVADLDDVIAAGEPGATLLWQRSAPETPDDDLAQRIRARGLPDSVVMIATLGGARLHPALGYRAESVEPCPDSPAWAVVAASGPADLVPLWTCGTVTVLSSADGSFLEWDAEENEPWTIWPDFADAVRSLLTDLWEDEADDAARAEIARLLLPAGLIAAALVPEER